jgi:hypothetical protein
VGEIAPADVVINADQETILKSFETSALNAIALEQNRRVIISGDSIRVNHVRSEGQALVNARDRIAHYHFGVLTHETQDLRASQG